MTVRRRWTTDEDEQLRALWNSAPKRRAISERLGRTAGAIKLRGRKLDLPRRDRQPRQLRGEDNRISNEPLDRRRNCLMCGEPFSDHALPVRLLPLQEREALASRAKLAVVTAHRDDKLDAATLKNAKDHP